MPPLYALLKYAGCIIGGLGALKIIFSELELFEVHWISLIVMGVGAFIYFLGVWEKSHYPTQKV